MAWLCCSDVSMSSCCNYEPTRETWYFKYGTMVQGPCTLIECRRKMYEASKHTATFFAAHIIDDLYEVQFSRELYTDVLVVINAPSGLEAGYLARKALACDYADTVPLDS